MRISWVPSTLAFVLGAGFLTTAGAALFFDVGPSKAIYPPQTNPLIFNHDYHIREEDNAKGIDGQGMDCDFCHEDMEESMSPADRNIPGHDVCELCHEDWIGDEETPAPVADCARCHADIRPNGTSREAKPMTIPAPNIKFAHGPHLEAGSECADCHPKVPEVKLATRNNLPTMKVCLDCHQNGAITVECRTCHLTDERNKLVQDYSSGQLKPQRYHAYAIHDENFLRDHALPAKRERAYCGECHDDHFCMDCHDGNGINTKYHPDAWLAMHSIRARKDDFRCQSCHRSQTFCLSCHIRAGVASAGSSPSNPLERRTLRLADTGNPNSPAVGPHPMGPTWVQDRSSRNFHGFHAQRNIRACAGCHQESYCIQCHGSAFGGRNGRNPSFSPHGPNPQRLRGSLAARQNARACLKCHSPADPSWR